MSIVEVKNLYLIFGAKKKQALELTKKGVPKSTVLEKTKCTIAVKNANFSIREGEIFVVMGLSGSGKSSLIRCLNRLNKPTGGSVIINGKDVARMDDQELRMLRRKEMAMVFQHFGLLPHRSVLSNAAFGLEVQGIGEEERYAKAWEMLQTVGLKGYENMMSSELSGGMQQRVGLARALTTDPDILLMDEAFSALDPLIRAQMQDELIDLQQKLKKTIVFITHDLDEGLKLGDHIAIMKDGEIVQIGTPEDILINPADDYVKAFVENVDRSRIVTAASIMFRDTGKLFVDKDGPALAIRRMREIGVSRLPVVDRNNHFLGFVEDKDVVQLKKEGEKDLNKILISNMMPMVSPDTPAADLLPLYINKRFPLPVVDDQQRLLGVAMHSSVIAEVTGRDLDEVLKIRNNGGV